MNIGKRRINSRISLSGKVISAIITLMLFCAISWTLVMFVNMTRNAKNIALDEEKSYMKTVESNSNGVEEVCNLAKQSISQNTTVLEYISLKQNGKELDSINKIDFYNNELSSIEDMININPYLYQIRLFVNADITEKKPCFYGFNRMKNLSWGNDYENGKWVFNYADTVFPKTVDKDIRLAGIVSEIKDDDGNLLAVLEISTEIENLLTDFFTDGEKERTCFITKNGDIYCAENQLKFWSDNKEGLLNYLDKEENINNSIENRFDNREVILSVLEMDTLGGYYIHMSDTSASIRSYYSSQIAYIILVMVTLMVFIFIVIITIKNIFRRFNMLTTDVARIKNGENIEIIVDGDDEISELGNQINNMVLSLEKLNKENTKRQLLVKNAEIKSLQNQINAHFMYNVLETIKMMAEIREEYEISDAITSLGSMFRYSMKWTSGTVEIKEEIKYIQDYMRLLNLRFDYEILLRLDIPDEFSEVKIPKMSLQPIVENAVNHGIDDIAEDTYINIRVFEEDNMINIEVSDAGVGMSYEKVKELNDMINAPEGVDDTAEHGRALYNVQQRIKMYFGKDYGIRIFSEKGLYTKVLIQIPSDRSK